MNDSYLNTFGELFFKIDENDEVKNIIDQASHVLASLITRFGEVENELCYGTSRQDDFIDTVLCLFIRKIMEQLDIINVLFSIGSFSETQIILRSLIENIVSLDYNPFAYIRSEKDILKLVNTIIVNTKGEGQQASEDFWVKAEKLYYTALIAYIWYEAPKEEQNFSMLIDLMDASEAREDDEKFKNAVDLLFEELEQKNPNHFAVRQYKKYKLAAGVVCSKRLLNQAVGKSLRTHNLKPKKGAQVMRKNEKITALYERLSRDDFGKDDDQQRESNSISNQKAMLEDFAARQGFTNIVHFTDDGISGTCFDRPGFLAMMKEVEAGNVEYLCIKDMSRMGRDYLKVGQIMEILRQRGVRLIAINDGVDSARGDDDFTPFRNIMNEYYARDPSRTHL